MMQKKQQISGTLVMSSKEMEVVGEGAVMNSPRKTVEQERKDLFNKLPKEMPGPGTPYFEIQPRLYRLWDINQKFFFLLNNTLIAAPRNSTSPEGLVAMIPNRGIEANETHKNPIFMGLGDRQHVLSCVEIDGQPQLEIVKEDIMGLYGKNEELRSFTFFNETTDLQQICSFESAAFRGWFISTSSEPNQPISLSREGSTEITTFHFEMA